MKSFLKNVRVTMFVLFAANIALANDHHVLFDGSTLNQWRSSSGGDPQWILRDGYVEVTPGKGDIETRVQFMDFALHVEFWVPSEPTVASPVRGNSGIYLQGRYEVQIHDSYRNFVPPVQACGALYDMLAPSSNASLAPEQWQTYDVVFKAPRLDESGHVSEQGEVTVKLNGVTVIDKGRFDRPTLGGDDLQGTPGPIRLQDHSSKVRYRNITLKEM